MKNIHFFLCLLISVNIFGSYPEISDNSSADFSLEFEDFPGWNRKQAITIDNSLVDGTSDLTNFPFLVTLDHLNDEIVNAGTNSAQNGGGDIRFSSDADGNIPLSIEVVEFTTSTVSANRKCQIWVKIPTLSVNSDTTIYIWYNKPGESQPAASSTNGSFSVWSDYEAVWHMENNPSLAGPQILDATGNGHNLSSSGSMTSSDVVSGQIGNAIMFDGTDDRFALATNAIINNGTFSITSWANFTGTNGYNGVLASTNPWSGLWINNGGGGRAVFYETAQLFGNGGSIPPNTNIKVDFTVANGTFQHFANGNADVGGSSNAPTFANFGFIGSEAATGTGGLFSGWIDEVRLSPIGRSASWLKTEHNNQTNPTAFAVKSTSLDATTGGSGTGGTTSSLWTQLGSDINYMSGNVGIGTTPQSNYKLAIDGHLRAKEIKVETANWPDYVFTKGYNLPTIEEVQKHIDQDGHLINLPSAKEIEANGLELGEMNRLLLEKIEELTLYIIQLKDDQNKQNIRLRNLENLKK